MRAWFLALTVQGALSACVPEKNYVTMSSCFSQKDTRFSASDVHTFTIHNGHTLTVTGFDSTRAIACGFRCFERCRLGDDADRALATVSGLDPGAKYRFRLWQFSRPEETAGGRWKNQMYVNGEKYNTRMGEDIAAYGYATAAEQGTVEFLFVDTNDDLRLGFSWVSLARVCGCASDRECPGGELCEGTEVERSVGDGVCVLGGECAPVDHRAAEYSCFAMAGNGWYAGNAWCSAWPSESQPKFMPMKMCCECSGGMSWVKTPYQLDNGGYEWRDFGGATAEGSAGAVVLEVGANHKVRGVVVDGALRKTPKNILASAGATSTGPWTQLATWRQDNFERVWTNLETEEPFLRLSWEETYGNQSSKLSNISVKLGDRAVDAVEPEGGWTGNFSLLSGSIASKPRCVVEDGCISSPDWPDRYPTNKRCEIEVVEDTVLVATRFEVADDRSDVSSDYFAIDSRTRRSSGVYTGSAGPYHVPVLAGDRLVWVVDSWEGAPGFRVCGYTSDGKGLPKWPPKEECSDLMTKRVCKKAGCDWKKKKNICKAKFECGTLKRGRCKKVGGAKGCEWNKGEKVCQVKGPD